ncbi:MAG: Alpha/beta hydrolase fold-3 domain protein [Streptosporangiaceae bacterium]|nr:Alpha/beta hydrolase fold-3 domain protein [Streptosporangiaceae bacterium]
MYQDPSPYARRPSVQSRAISQALRLGVRPFVSRLPGHAMSLRTARTAADAAARLIRSDPRVRVEQLVDPRVSTDPANRPVVGEWVIPTTKSTTDGAILYLHGGGYVACSPRTHRPITVRLAVDSQLPVLALRYRLAPEHPFPAALLDALDAYRFLLARGIPGSRIIVAGDSAGGHLAASLAGELCRVDLPLPAGIVLYSPWVDLSCKLSSERDHGCRDPYVSLAAARVAGQLYVGKGDFDDPRLSLLTCPWTSTPPFFVQVGGGEVLRGEAEQLAEVLRLAGATCELQVWAGQMHVFQMLNQVLPEARAAMLETARFIRTTISKPAAGGEAA